MDTGEVDMEDNSEFTLEIDIPEELQHINNNDNSDTPHFDFNGFQQPHLNQDYEYDSDTTIIVDYENNGHDIQLRGSENVSGSEDGSTDNDYFEVDNVPNLDRNTNRNKTLPIYPIDNLNIDILPADEANGWIREQRDSGSSCGPFLSASSTIIDLTNPKPEVFFNHFFDERMWTQIAEATNEYAHSKSRNDEGISIYCSYFYLTSKLEFQHTRNRPHLCSHDTYTFRLLVYNREA